MFRLFFNSMFFTPELLARRDSGFGLLWLAATLGSKDAFKKLPKRSVLTADISHLCGQISEPAEPLALRLSSNLMFGVVRVYKVKQEIFLTDVTNCVTSLKKVVQDLRGAAAQDKQVQMANPVARPSAVTLVPNPRAAHSLDYDALVIDWDEYLNIGGTAIGGYFTDGQPHLTADATIGDIQVSDGRDENLDPTERRKKRAKSPKKDVPETEVVRKETHTLDEHHEHVLSASYDLSFHSSTRGAGIDPSSSQVSETVFDNFFSDALENGDGFGLELGEDLARELGWAISPVKSVRGSDRHSDLNFDNFNAQVQDADFNFDALAMDLDQVSGPLERQLDGLPNPAFGFRKQKKEDSVPVLGVLSTNPQMQTLSPATSFSRQLLSQDIELFQPLRDITAEERNKENQSKPPKKLKKTRLLLDARTELTDEELKIARAKYMQSQRLQRRELLYKKHEKKSGQMIEEMILGGPKGMHAQELINFWQQTFMVQVETRSGTVRLHEDDDYEHALRPKRRRVGPKGRRIIQEPPVPALVNDKQGPLEANLGANMDACMDWSVGNQDIDVQLENNAPFRHSSEELGQARRVSSRSGSIIDGHLGLHPVDLDRNRDSQQSSLFPWDNAGLSSSNGNDHALDFNLGIEAVDVRLGSRRGSSSQRGSIVGGLVSPAGGSQAGKEDFAVEDNPLIPEATRQETQKSDVNLATLEKHSYNFLEYIKMQHRSLPEPDCSLGFELIVPKNTSTRHIAAAAFYHCLVLATKHLIRLEQPQPYAPVLINII